MLSLAFTEFLVGTLCCLLKRLRYLELSIAWAANNTEDHCLELLAPQPLCSVVLEYSQPRILREQRNAVCNRHFVSTDSASAKLIHVFRKIFVVGFHAHSLSFYMEFYSKKYLERLAHVHYYPCLAFIFCASVHPYISLHMLKMRPGDEA